MGRTPLRTATCLAVVVAVFGPATLAWGHASSQLPHARLSAQGQQVHVEWTAAADDAADVGVGLGLLPEDAMWAFLGEPGAAYPTDAEVRQLSNAPQLHAYLLDNVAVTQGEVSCDGEVSTTDDFLVDGARFVFTCPDPVELARVRITMLHDRDELYATYSVDGTVQYAIHSAAQPEHEWDFTLAAQQQRAVPPALPIGIALAVAVIAATLWWLRPRPASAPADARSSGGRT